VCSAGQVLHLRFEVITKVGNTKSATFVQLRGVLNSVNASAGGHFNTSCCARVCVSIVFSRSCFINWNTDSPGRVSTVHVFIRTHYWSWSCATVPAAPLHSEATCSWCVVSRRSTATITSAFHSICLEVNNALEFTFTPSCVFAIRVLLKL